MGSGIKVSVILPSLNVAMYIEECMESVLRQSLQDIEIICVDAGSDDGTLEVLKKYAAADKRVKVILSDKKSYGYQLNLGIDAACGEYIGIVDTDDYVPEEMYGELYHKAKENKADFVKADFYRFTGNGCKRKKTLCRLTEDMSYYNRVINIEKEPECFLFPMNTWSGIYNKKFLSDHGIVHNESEGASFQDNGFWFQTFMYAKRAFFLNKPYYRNRRDNPASSVYSKDKVYCVCEEYRFIEDILNKERRYFETYKYVFTYIYFQVCKWNLYRIASAYRKDFLERFAEDFERFYKRSMLKQSMFCAEDWQLLGAVLQRSVDILGD